MFSKKKRQSPSRKTISLSTTPQVLRALEILRLRSGTTLSVKELATLLVSKQARKEYRAMQKWGKPAKKDSSLRK